MKALLWLGTFKYARCMSEDKIVISDEAVEAAAIVILRGTDAGHHAYKIAYATLEAAATHMLADVWDEGHEACARDEEDSYWGPSAVTRPNPYRSQE